MADAREPHDYPTEARGLVEGLHRDLNDATARVIAAAVVLRALEHAHWRGVQEGRAMDRLAGAVAAAGPATSVPVESVCPMCRDLCGGRGCHFCRRPSTPDAVLAAADQEPT